jgi:acyl phosphate:glycerol-3-phosphate acyltransferase
VATLLILVAYLAGSIPTGLLLARRAGIDPRRVGSGNIGATNVARSAGLRIGLGTLAGDATKGGLPVLAAHWLGFSEQVAAAAGVAAVVGHIAPIGLRFRGGKGVATALGAMLALAPAAAAASVAVFAAVAWHQRLVSLASILAVMTALLALLVTGAPAGTTAAMTGVAVLIVARHHENVRRLIAGTEPRLALPKERAAPKD